MTIEKRIERLEGRLAPEPDGPFYVCTAPHGLSREEHAAWHRAHGEAELAELELSGGVKVIEYTIRAIEREDEP